MKNTTFYTLKTDFENSLITNKGKLSFSFFCLFLLVTAFSSYKTEAEPIGQTIKQSQIKSHSKINTASVTYRTVRSFHETKRLTVRSNNNYVVFSPKVIQPESNFVYKDVNKSGKKSFYTANFFEKAMRFNDTLQTWVK